MYWFIPPAGRVMLGSRMDYKTSPKTCPPPYQFSAKLPGLSPLGYSHVAPAMYAYVAKSKHTENKVRYSNLPRPTKWSGLDSAKTKPFIFSPWHMVSNRVCALLPAGVGEGWKLALHKDVYSAIAAPSSEQELTRR